MPSLSTDDLHAFVAAAKCQSLSAAAAYLDVPRSSLTRRIERLEAQTKTTLFKRDGRTLSLTDAGRRVHKHAQAMLDAGAALVRAAQPDTPAVVGTLRVAMPLGFAPEGQTAFWQALRRLHPGLSLRTVQTAAAPHTLADTFDLVLSTQSSARADWVVKPLARTQRAVYAAPAYLEAHGTPESAGDLATHATIGLGHEQDAHVWPLAAGGHFVVTPWLTTNSIDAARRAALAGEGLALLPEASVRRDVRAGTLQTVLTGVVGAPSGLFLHFAQQDRHNPAVQAYLQAVKAFAAPYFAEFPAQAPAWSRAQEGTSGSAHDGSHERAPHHTAHTTKPPHAEARGGSE